MSQYIIQTRDLTKTYGEQKSVSNLNMHVRKGKIYGIGSRNCELADQIHRSDEL
jgi:bacitracin transport system ATP-binding protein